MPLPEPRAIALFSAAAAAAALAVALATERFGGLAPCALCLWERWPYRVAAAAGLLVLLLPRRFARPLLFVLLASLLAGAGLAALHVGVEQHFWPSPLPECLAPRLAHGSIAQMLASMPARPSKPCDAPSYLIPGLRLSMAAMNLLYALCVSALLAIYLGRSRGVRR